MGVYDSDYVCEPYPNNPIWIPVVTLQFIIVTLGVCSHVIFFQLVVARKRFSTYLRLVFGLISLQMVIMLATSTGAFLITLAHGKYIEDCEISDITVRKWLLYVHSFGEFFFVACELMGTFERVTSTFSNKFRKTKKFKTIFGAGLAIGALLSGAYIYLIRIAFVRIAFAIGFGTLTMMEILNAIAVGMLYKWAKFRYNKASESLESRYEFSQAFTYSKCAVASVIARIFIITYVYLKLSGFFEGTMDSPFFYFMNVLINLYCLVYPWTIMLSHRKIRNQLKGMFKKFFAYRVSILPDHPTPRKLYTIDGARMNHHTTSDYFSILNSQWTEKKKSRWTRSVNFMSRLLRKPRLPKSRAKQSNVEQ